MDGVGHGGGLEGLPALLPGVEGGVEQDEVRVQLRIEGAGGGVQEGRADGVAGGSVPFLDAALSDDLLQPRLFPTRHRALPLGHQFRHPTASPPRPTTEPGKRATSQSLLPAMSA